jgi:hypothetical protein
MTSPTLEITPRVPARGAVSNGEPASPYPRSSAAGQAFVRATRPDYDNWLDHVRAAGACTRPVRLVGDVYTVHGGESGLAKVLAVDSTHAMPDSVIYKPCGNRRAVVCPACARTYQQDAYQLLRAGLVGGKGVPDTVSRHPAVFVTYTAPSFGTVHTRVVRKHTCTNRRRCDCRAEPCHARRDVGRCEHGSPAVCWARHEPTDRGLGRPLCLDCYDHDHQVIWNHLTGELWRRTKQAAERYLAQLARRRGITSVVVVSESGKLRRIPPVRISHGKAAEFQARGAVHFHALLRLDGIDARDLDAVVPPPAGITGPDLEDALRHAAAQVVFHTPAHPDQPDGWTIGWGDQLDIRHINLTPRGEVTDSMVAGYLAKYATKSTEVTGHSSTRLDLDTIGDYADPDGDHIARLIDSCWRLGRPTHTPVPLLDWPRRAPDRDSETSRSAPRSMWTGLRRWAHMLGFGGHFLTKARHYSVTFTRLRDTRITYRRGQERDHDQAAIRTADHLGEETTLTVGVLTFAGVGWHTTGDALLANTAAALARERRQAGHEELAHELGTTIAGTLPAVA